MPRRATDIADSDAHDANELYTQIRANHAAMERQDHLALARTPFRSRSKDLRGGSTSNPQRDIEPRFPGGNLASIEPAILLYKRLVGHALPIFHTLLLRKPVVLPRTDSSQTRSWEFPAPLRQLTQEQKNHTWILLAGIRRHLTWAYGEKGKNGFSQAVEGSTQIQDHLPLVHDGLGLLGCASKIKTDSGMILDIENSLEYSDSAAQKWHSFRLAIVWLHELSHAVINAVLPGMNWQEAFLGPGASTTEIGMEMEARVFSGSFVRLKDPTLSGVWLREWPDCQAVREYQRVGWGCETRGSADGLTSEWSILWAVRASFWEVMFDDAFWEQSKAGELAAFQLWPEKSFGVLRVIGDRDLSVQERIDVDIEMRIRKCTLREHKLVLTDSLAAEVEDFDQTDSDGTDESDCDEMRGGDEEMGVQGDEMIGMGDMVEKMEEIEVSSGDLTSKVQR
ncbi:hypothetical protein TI39_contig403g00003 [Zymoseptoria brevis]|uniref:Uncharacterized protein n=1 Tax=Zymoseptoria brevis TaxID=1047168 RepID=A0A0F4GQW9_9PEZI|nr:hypothetical protein TI39_contig403g00003 [Zymoseptoria brevis]